MQIDKNICLYLSTNTIANKFKGSVFVTTVDAFVNLHSKLSS